MECTLVEPLDIELLVYLLYLRNYLLQHIEIRRLGMYTFTPITRLEFIPKSGRRTQDIWR